MISKFCHFIKLNKTNIACFNSILFKPIILNDQEYRSLKNGNYEFFNPEELSQFYNRGILIKDLNQDIDAENKLKEYVNNCIQNGISLIYIIPSNICNLACKYCFIGSLDDKYKEELSVETIDNIVKKYTQYLTENQIEKATIVFYGGEPLTAFKKVEYTVEQFKKVKNIKWEFAIVTNATLINEKIIDFFEENNFGVGISIDGPKKVNDKNRIFKNNLDISVYDSIIKNIKAMQNKKINLGLSITLTEEILNNQDEFLDWLKNLGVRDINYNLLHFTQKTKEWKEYYNRASDFLFKSNNFLAPHSIIDDRLQRKIRAFGSNEFKYNDCGAIGGHQLCFNPKGDITVCHGYWHSNKEICGNINRNSFKEITQTDNFKKWQNNLTINKPKCIKCPAIYICGGGCAMQSNDLFENQHELDKGFCIHTKKSLKALLKNLI